MHSPVDLSTTLNVTILRSQHTGGHNYTPGFVIPTLYRHVALDRGPIVDGPLRNQPGIRELWVVMDREQPSVPLWQWVSVGFWEPEDLILVRDPEKKPTVLEQSMCSEEAFPELLLQVREAQAQAKFVEPKEELEIRLGDHYSEVIGDYTDSEPPEEDWIGLKDSSDLEREDAESDNGSIDSIAHQADFIEF